jgi:hypothetical protein
LAAESNPLDKCWTITLGLGKSTKGESNEEVLMRVAPVEKKGAMVFCQECGNKLGEAGKFCSGCGAARVTEPLNVSETPESYSSSNLSEAWAEHLSWWEKALPLGVGLQGFINAEVGQVWISDKPIYSCEVCDDDFSGAYKRVDCSDCGKSPTASVCVPVGTGDGTYPIYGLNTSNPSFGGILGIWATAKGTNANSPLPDLLRGVLESDDKQIAEEHLQAKRDFALFMVTDDFDITSFGSIELVPNDLKIGGINFPDLTQFIFSGPRSRQYLDAAEVRNGWEPGVFEVLGITRAGELERIKSALAGDSSWFNRPEFIAVLLIRKEDLAGVVPPDKVIHSVEDFEYLSASNRWIEANRVSRGDLPAVWANWELSAKAKKSDSLPGLFRSLCEEGYLHQIWNWVTTNPPSLQRQLDNRAQLSQDFERLVEYSSEPKSPLTRSDLRGWFLQD